jgi:hypothetical protein
MNKLSRYIPYLLILILLIFALLPLLNKYHIFGHDTFFNVIRLTQIDRCFKEGLYSARWAPDFSNGYGYPIFNFISPFVYYIGEIFVLLGLNFINSVKGVYILGFILSGIFMYVFTKELWGKWGGLLSSLSYIYVPYRLVDIYVRGAQVEFFAFTFIPLIFWSAYKFAREKGIKYFVILVLSNAFFVITHNISAMIFTPLIILYFLLLSLTQPEKKIGLYFIGGFLLSLGISAFFWLPALRESKFVNIGIMTQEKFYFSHHFVYLKQLFQRRWAHGLSLPGYNEGEMPYQIGITHFILSLIPFFFLRSYKKLKYEVLFFQFLFFLGIFFTLRYSSFFWEKLPLIQYVQFPWRFLMVVAFSSSVLSGAIALPLKTTRVKFMNPATIVIFLFLILGANIKYCRAIKAVFPYGFERENILNYPAGFSTTTIQNEYLPRWVKDEPSKPAFQKIEFPLDKMKVENVTIKAGKYRFSAYSKTKVRVKINTFYFPGWKGYIDGKETRIEYDNPQGLMYMDIPEGEHCIQVMFKDTAVRRGAKITSFLSLILLIITASVLKRK